MIIWLASYPRSGNTLLRTVCRACFGLYSYADEPVYYNTELRNNAEWVGHIERREPWPEFYAKANRSDERYLVKTHLFPVDENPFIYVVRDGREAIKSYQRFKRNFNRVEIALLDLIMGAEYYGGWSEHYRQWNLRNRPNRLVLKFEDLVDLSEATLFQIRDFLDYSGAVKPWQNPVADLKKVEPNFFSSSLPDAAGYEEWTPWHEYLFQKVHGDLMRRLGYGSDRSGLEAEAAAPGGMDQRMDEMIQLIDRLRRENRRLSLACDERQRVIDELKTACEERLRIIQQLNDTINDSH